MKIFYFVLIQIVLLSSKSFQDDTNSTSQNSTEVNATLTSITVTSDENSTNSTTTPMTTTTRVTTTTKPFRRQPDREGVHSCASNGSTYSVFTDCGYKVNVSQNFKFETCPSNEKLPFCEEGEYGYGNCMLCIKGDTKQKPSTSGRVLIESGLINATSPQCQVRVRVVSKGSEGIGSWRVFARNRRTDTDINDRLVASLYGSYEGEMSIVAKIGSFKNFHLVVLAEQWSNFSGHKGLGSIDFEFCNVTTYNKNDFKCSNGNTVSKAVVCDFVDDCGDSSDEKPETAGCSHLTEHCMFPQGCSIKHGWNPIKGRIIPHIGGGFDGKTRFDGFLPPVPKIAPGVTLIPGVTDQPEFLNGAPLIVDLSSKLIQADDSFVFSLPEIDATRDVDDVQKCWLRFHYFAPPGLQVHFDVRSPYDAKDNPVARNLHAVSSFGWIREQIELPLADYDNESYTPIHRPEIKISYRGDRHLQEAVGVNGIVGFWGFSYSQGCRVIYNYCPSDMEDRKPQGCREHELLCKAHTPVKPSEIIDTMLAPVDGSHPKDFCFSPRKKCDFHCDCHDCSDEAECGESCDFANAASCGWLTGDNWVWPSRDQSLCNGKACIITSPDIFFHNLPAPEFLKSRTLISNMYEWINPSGCNLTFSYRLWPETALSVIHMYSQGSKFLFRDIFNGTSSVTNWKTATINFDQFDHKHLRKFRIAFLPESIEGMLLIKDLQTEDPEDHVNSAVLANFPVAISDVQFSKECGALTPKKATDCPASPAICQTDTDSSDCVAYIEEPFYSCDDSLINCNKTVQFLNSICTWQQPSLASSSQPQIATSEVLSFDSKDSFCDSQSCFIVVWYNIIEDQSPSAYLALVIEETETIETNSDNVKVGRRQRLWQVTSADYNSKTSAEYLVRIPINYCPSDLDKNKNRRVSIQFEGTAGSPKMEIRLMGVQVNKNCFAHRQLAFERKPICNDEEVRCSTDQRCYPRSYICDPTVNNPSFLRQLCPSSHDSGSHGFQISDSANCFAVQKSVTIEDDDSWSAAQITAAIIGGIAVIIVVVLASYAATKRTIRWYRSGGGHRTHASRSNISGDGHHFSRLATSSNQMMLDMLINDEDV